MQEIAQDQYRDPVGCRDIVFGGIFLCFFSKIRPALGDFFKTLLRPIPDNGGRFAFDSLAALQGFSCTITLYPMSDMWL